MAAPGGALEEINPIIVRRAPRLDLPKYNGLTDPVRFLQIYVESCEVYGEIYPQDKLKLFPMALTVRAQHKIGTIIKMKLSVQIGRLLNEPLSHGSNRESLWKTLSYF